jgi:tetratricopeptide (TPR) repeat protein
MTLHRMSWNVSLWLLLALLASCTSRLNITVTPPEARLSLESLGGGAASDLGAGSALVDADLLEQRSINVPFLIRASMPGRAPLAVLVTGLPSSEQQVFLSLPEQEARPAEENQAPETEQTSGQNSLSLRVSNPTVWNDTMRKVLEAERYLNQKDFERALGLAQGIQEQAPWLAIGFVLEASALYLQGEKTRARGALERAVALDPEDGTTKQLLVAIDRELGVPEGAAGGAP